MYSPSPNHQADWALSKSPWFQVHHCILLCLHRSPGADTIRIQDVLSRVLATHVSTCLFRVAIIFSTHQIATSVGTFSNAVLLAKFILILENCPSLRKTFWADPAFPLGPNSHVKRHGQDSCGALSAPVCSIKPFQSYQLCIILFRFFKYVSVYIIFRTDLRYHFQETHLRHYTLPPQLKVCDHNWTPCHLMQTRPPLHCPLAGRSSAATFFAPPTPRLPAPMSLELSI